MKKTSDCLIIIPAYNEEETLAEVVVRSQQYADVCVVNDASTDSTADVLRRLDDVHVVTHTVNTHIAQATLDGMRVAVEHGYPYAITMDAGLSHDPAEIPLFIEAEAADLVMGARARKSNTPLYRRACSWMGNFIYNVSLDFPQALSKRTYYSDLSSGFRRYSNRAMHLLLSKPLISRSFDFQFESAMLAYSHGLTLREVPITYTFSGSSFNRRVVQDCIHTCARTILSQMVQPRLVPIA